MSILEEIKKLSQETLVHLTVKESGEKVVVKGKAVLLSDIEKVLKECKCKNCKWNDFSKFPEYIVSKCLLLGDDANPYYSTEYGCNQFEREK